MTTRITKADNTIILSATLQDAWVELFLTDGKALSAHDRIQYANFSLFELESSRVLQVVLDSEATEITLQLSPELDEFDWETVRLPDPRRSALGKIFSVSRSVLDARASSTNRQQTTQALRVVAITPYGARKELLTPHGNINYAALSIAGLSQLAESIECDVLSIEDLDLTAQQFKMFCSAINKKFPLILLENRRDNTELKALAEQAAEALIIYADGQNPTEQLSQFWLTGTRCSHAMRQIYRPGMRLYGDSVRRAYEREEQKISAPDSHQFVVSMSYDLVGSTEIMSHIGHERYSVLLKDFHKLAQNEIRAYGGYPEEHYGNDGVVSHFGFPRSVENATSKAVAASLSVIRSVNGLGLNVRIGIAVGNTAIHAGQPIGLSVHLAARLQSQARPNTILISEEARQIVARNYEVERLSEELTLKGIGLAGDVYKIVCVKQNSYLSPGDVLSANSSMILGRDMALAEIRAELNRIDQGEMPILVISGEAGIGKTQIITSLVRSELAANFEFIVLRAEPEAVASPFQTLGDWVRRSNENAHPSVFSQLSEPTIEAIRRITFASKDFGAEKLLGPKISAQAHREAGFIALLEWLHLAAQKKPICVVLEDAQWLDPSTLELLSRLEASRSKYPNVAIILTKRTESVVEWYPAGGFVTIQLDRLTATDARALFMKHAGAEIVPERIIQEVVAQSEGVPLYLVESGRMFAADKTQAINSAFKIPGSIQELMLARLDQAFVAKRLAQLASVFGRDFNIRQLKQLLRLVNDDASLSEIPFQIAALLRANIVYNSKSATDTDVYRFSHILLRDTAYRSLWESDKRNLHAKIANLLESERGIDNSISLELIAHHITESGEVALAVSAWERAAKLAVSKSALRESLRLMLRALELNARLPHSIERDKTELRVQLSIAARYIASEGYGAKSVQQSYSRALELANSLLENEAIRKSQLGLEAYYFMRAEFDKAHELLEQSQHRNHFTASSWDRIQLCWSKGNICWHQGRLQEAIVQMNRCLDLYSGDTHRTRSVQDPAVMSLCYSSWSYWEMGDAKEALERVNRALDLAQRLGHPFSIGVAQGFVATLLFFTRQYEDSLRVASDSVQCCEENGFAVWAAHAHMIVAAVQAARGATEQGIAGMDKAYALWVASGAMVTRPFYLSLKAQILLDSGRYSEVKDLANQGLLIADAGGEHYHKAELLRQKALALIGLDSGDADSLTLARSVLEEAIVLAQSQGKAIFELRAALALNRINVSHDVSRQSLAKLQTIYEKFSATPMPDAYPEFGEAKKFLETSVLSFKG